MRNEQTRQDGYGMDQSEALREIRQNGTSKVGQHTEKTK
jgi:hypothetical protein